MHLFEDEIASALPKRGSKIMLSELPKFQNCPKDIKLSRWLTQRGIFEICTSKQSGQEYVRRRREPKQDGQPQQQQAASSRPTKPQPPAGAGASPAGAEAARSKRAAKGEKRAEGEAQANSADRALAKSLKRRRKGAQKQFCEVDAGDQLEELIQDSRTSHIQFANLSSKQRQLVKAMAAALRLEAAVERAPAADGMEARLDVKVVVVRKTRLLPGVVPAGGVQRALDAVRQERAEHKAQQRDTKQARTESTSAAAAKSTGGAAGSSKAAAATAAAAVRGEDGEDAGLPKLRWVIDRNIKTS